MTSPQTIARVAGVLYLANIALGVFALVTMQDIVVANDAAQTAANITSSELLFRLASASLVLAGVAYVGVIGLLYELMKPAGRALSAVAAFLGVAGCAIGAVTGVHQIGALMYLGDAAYLAAFNQEQLNALARLSVRIAGLGNTFALVFFGFYCAALAALVFRSRFLPRWLGLLLALAGVGWIIGTFTSLVSPALGFSSVLLPVSGIGEALFTLWLLAMGVNAERWRQQENAG